MNMILYFQYNNKVYKCIGNDDNMLWTEIDGKSKGFEKSNCAPLFEKRDYSASDFYTGKAILVNGELCTVDHIKPFDFSSTVKDGYAIVFEGGNGILETDDRDIIKLLAP